MAEIFALSIWRDPDNADEARDRTICTVAEFALDNRDDPETVFAVLDAVSRGETYRLGGGAAPIFEISAVANRAVAEHINAMEAGNAG